VTGLGSCFLGWPALPRDFADRQTGYTDPTASTKENMMMEMSDDAARFKRAAEGFSARIAAVRPDQWQTQSPCPNWTARDVTVHVINETRRMLSTVRRVEPEAIQGVGVAEMGALPQTEPAADLAAAFKQASDGLTTAIDDPDCRSVELPTFAGPQPFSGIVDSLPEDVLIHTWDLARATGGDERLDPDLVEYVFERFKPLDEILRQPWAFGPKVTPPANADHQTEFLCFVGRQP
jgi:uncharacterized protein (TIGR03086 family)